MPKKDAKTQLVVREVSILVVFVTLTVVVPRLMPEHFVDLDRGEGKAWWLIYIPLGYGMYYLLVRIIMIVIRAFQGKF